MRLVANQGSPIIAGDREPGDDRGFETCTALASVANGRSLVSQMVMAGIIGLISIQGMSLNRRTERLGFVVEQSLAVCAGDANSFVPAL